MLRKRILTLISAGSLVLFLSACTMWVKSGASTWKNSTGAEQFERLFWKDVQAGEWQELERHMASNYVFMGPSGTMNKQQMLANLRLLRLTDFSIGDINVTPQGSDMIVTYRIQMAGDKAGTPIPDHPVLFLSVWQQREHGWELVAQTQTEPR